MKTSCKDNLNTSSRRLEDIIGRRIANIRRKFVTLKTSSRHLEEVLENKKEIFAGKQQSEVSTNFPQDLKLHSSYNWISTINFNDDRSECTKNKINYEPCKHPITYALSINHHFYVLQFCLRHSSILVFIRQMLISWIELSWSYLPNYGIENYSWGSQGESSRFWSTWNQLN